MSSELGGLKRKITDGEITNMSQAYGYLIGFVELDNRRDAWYKMGKHRAALEMYDIIRNNLPDEVSKPNEERAETIIKLRELCNEYGDNDWEDGLHLVDILDKHLFNYL